MPNIEEEYLDVLQNIEFAIVLVYRQQRELTDYDVDKVLNALIKHYQAEQQQRTFERPRLSLLAEQVYENVQRMCEWRLGRARIVTESNDVELGTPEPLTVDEIIGCLKRIHKSVGKWNKRGGRRGYLQYVDQFIP